MNFVKRITIIDPPRRQFEPWALSRQGSPAELAEFVRTFSPDGVRFHPEQLENMRTFVLAELKTFAAESKLRVLMESSATATGRQSNVVITPG